MLVLLHHLLVGETRVRAQPALLADGIRHRVDLHQQQSPASLGERHDVAGHAAAAERRDPGGDRRRRAPPAPARSIARATPHTTEGMEWTTTRSRVSAWRTSQPPIWSNGSLPREEARCTRKLPASDAVSNRASTNSAPARAQAGEQQAEQGQQRRQAAERVARVHRGVGAERCIDEQRRGDARAGREPEQRAAPGEEPAALPRQRERGAGPAVPCRRGNRPSRARPPRYARRVAPMAARAGSTEDRSAAARGAASRR